MWVRFGADGQPTNVHARYTLPDGSLHQEIVQDGSQETIIFAPADAPSKAGCRAAAPSSPARMRDSRPPFVDEAALPAAGFLRAGGLTAQPPVTRPLPGVRPALVHPSDPVANGWETKTASSGIRLASRFEVGSQGRLLAARTWRIDSTGLVLGETRAVYGPLEEYESAVVPSDSTAESARTSTATGRRPRLRPSRLDDGWRSNLATSGPSRGRVEAVDMRNDTQRVSRKWRNDEWARMREFLGWFRTVVDGVGGHLSALFLPDYIRRQRDGIGAQRIRTSIRELWRTLYTTLVTVLVTHLPP